MDKGTRKLIAVRWALALVVILLGIILVGLPGCGNNVPGTSQAVSEEWDTRNREVTLLSSAGRITTTNTSTQANYTHLGLLLFVDVTSRAGSTTLTPNLQVQEPVGDNWITVWTAAAAINSSDTTIAYLFYPSGLADAAALYTEAVDMTIGRTWRATVTHSDTSTITYTLSCSLVK